MHLGRFHAVIDKLERRFREGEMLQNLRNAADAMEQFHHSRAESYLQEFKNRLNDFYQKSSEHNPELLQPYAQQVIDEIGFKELMPPLPAKRVQNIVSRMSFDSLALVEELRKQVSAYQTKIDHLKNLDTALRGLSAEYTSIEDDKAELGFLIPREIVGETLAELTKEFDKISLLGRAVNELTGAENYDPKVVTISSSWWQIFLEITPEQVALWVMIIERVVGLFKSNLEIKNLQSQLKEKNLPEKILSLISKEVESQVSTELKKIASDAMDEYGKIEDPGRKNEIETQLRQGLNFFAKRLNQGAQVEINVGVPNEPEDPQAKDGEQPDPLIIEANNTLRARIAELRKAREIGMKASETSLQVGQDAPILLEDSSK